RLLGRLIGCDDCLVDPIAPLLIGPMQAFVVGNERCLRQLAADLGAKELSAGVRQRDGARAQLAAAALVMPQRDGGALGVKVGDGRLGELGGAGAGVGEPREQGCQVLRRSGDEPGTLFTCQEYRRVRGAIIGQMLELPGFAPAGVTMADGVIQRSDDCAHLAIHGARLTPLAQAVAPGLHVVAHDVFEPHTPEFAFAADRQAESLPGVPGARAPADRALVLDVGAQRVPNRAAGGRAMYGFCHRCEPGFGLGPGRGEIGVRAKRLVLLLAVAIAVPSYPRARRLGSIADCGAFAQRVPVGLHTLGQLVPADLRGDILHGRSGRLCSLTRNFRVPHLRWLWASHGNYTEIIPELAETCRDKNTVKTSLS